MIFHITNDYSGSTVYKNLIGELDKLSVPQIVYNPIRKKNSIGKNEIELDTINSRILYSHILNKTTDRIFYRKKIKKIVKDIEEKINLTQIKLIHAHTWYSDGGVAYLLSKKYNIPYIVTIRNSDLNVFQKYLFHERAFGRKILERAKSVILIAAFYKQRVLDLESLEKIKSSLQKKLQIIPNGVDPFWLSNFLEKKSKNTNVIFNLLYIGKFNRGKNVLALQKAISEINKKEKRVHLHLIGGGGNVHTEVLKQVNHYKEIMTYHGKIFDLVKLKQYFGNADFFVMPSKQETFGLVYVEAMLQGLPILYTAKEGIDGLYQEKIGEKVSKQAGASEIKQAILKLIDNDVEYEIPTQKLLENHNWENIALIYQKLYNTQ